MILSPALAAVLFNVWNLSSIVLLDVFGAAVAITMILFIPIPKTAPEGKVNRVHIWQDTKEGMAVLSAVRGMTIPFFYGLRTAIFQSRISNEYLGRVLSLSYSVSLFAAPLGLLLGGGVSEAAGVENCFFICGVLAVCLALAMLVTPSIRNSCNEDVVPK